MIRRGFLFALVGLAVSIGSFGLSSTAAAQQPAAPRRIGVLLVSFSPESKEAQAFRQGLKDAGYTEGRDVVIEWRSAEGDYGRVPELAVDLVQSKVDVIVVDSTIGSHGSPCSARYCLKPQILHRESCAWASSRRFRFPPTSAALMDFGNVFASLGGSRARISSLRRAGQKRAPTGFPRS